MPENFLFVVVKEYDARDPDTLSDLAEVDNTIRIMYRDFGDDCYQYDLYVRRRNRKTYDTIPYGITAYSEKDVIRFVKFICSADSRLSIDMYHASYPTTETPQATIHSDMEWLSQFETESRSIVGFEKKELKLGGSRMLKRTLKQLKHAYPI
jgi:hypothetical protein